MQACTCFQHQHFSLFLCHRPSKGMRLTDVLPLAGRTAQTEIHVAVGSTMRGVLVAADALRADAPATVRALQQRGLRVMLVSGRTPAPCCLSSKIRCIRLAAGCL